MQRVFSAAILAALLFASLPAEGQAQTWNPHFLVSDEEMTDIFAMTRGEIQTFLTRGSLASWTGSDIEGRLLPAADIIWQEAQRFGLNPQFLLALLQREQSLVQHPNPTQNQLDWAMGYAVCDSCSKDDPAIQKFRGFGVQIHYAAKRIRESYLADLDATGRTVSGVGPGVRAVIDGVPIYPANRATSVLYTYTPHLHGNRNFVTIWDRWFRKEYPTGSLLRDADTGGVYLIQFGKKRPITSMTAFQTRFDPNMVIVVKPSDLEAYETGNPISFPNYSLLRTPDGGIFLIVDDTARGIVSMEAFRSIGFNPDEIVDVTDEDLRTYQSGPPITLETKDPQGLLLQDPRTGGVFFVREGRKSPIMSKEILANRFPSWPINLGTADTLDGYATFEPVGFRDGSLVAATGSPDVFVISEGMRRHIADEATFAEFGYDWDTVIWTNERSVLVHSLGDPLTLNVEDVPDEVHLATSP